MLSELGAVKRAWSRWTALVVLASLAACVDNSLAPTPETPTRTKPRVLGFIELTFTGIGTPEMASSILTAPTLAELEALRTERERSGEVRDIVTRDLTVPERSDGSGDGTIQLSRIASGELVHEGARYLHTTFAVRNAQLDGSPYDTERTNLTFLAVGTSNTLSETAVRELRLGNGSPADPALTLEVLPTGLPILDADDNLAAAHPDVLQVLTEAEVAAVDAPPAVTNIFPYGFMVRRTLGPTSRTLSASPGPDQFDGEIDFGFRIPLQEDPADDPESLTVMMLAVDDSDTRVTQSLLEQGVDERNELRDYANLLNPSMITLLPGGTLLGASGLRTLCTVRAAGTATAPTAYVVNADRSLATISPDPYATDGSGSFISGTTAFEATFSATADGIGPEHFAVRGQHSGPAFLGQQHSGNGTTTITTPPGDFYPGEEVEITLNSRLLCPQPQVFRFRVATAPGTGSFNQDGTYTVGTSPLSVGIGDLDDDGNLDLMTANHGSNDASVLLGNGDGTYQGQQTFVVGTQPRAAAPGDLNGDGILDLVTANQGSNDVSVLLGNGDGTFQAQQTFAVGSAPYAVAVGDLNGDAVLDLVTANQGSNSVSVLLGFGDGTFQAQQTFSVDNDPWDVAVGDLNGDGVLDIVSANNLSNNFLDPDNVSVLLGNGDGTFQAQQTFAVGAVPWAVALGDVNGNGILDIVVANLNSANVSVLLGNGDGTFQAQQMFSAGSSTSLALGDLNGNGILDIVTGHRTGTEASILLGNGDGTFQSPQPFSAGTSPLSVALGDLNGNGVLDVAIANSDVVSNNFNEATVALGQAQP